MARTPRFDRADSWHHVMNRGIASRPIFEKRSDLRFFLSLLARASRRGWIELHGYALMTTHFHLLVRSPVGRLSETIGWVEQRYVLRFNRRHRRDGPLFRSRFVSRHVDTKRYWRVVVQYIDQNPVAAGLANDAAEYPWSSRRHFERTTGPRWLARAAIEAEVRARCGLAAYEPAMYRQAFPGRVPAGAVWVVERRLGTQASDDPAETDLLRAAPERVLRGLAARARCADGRALGSPVASPDEVVRAVDEVSGDPWTIRITRRRVDGRTVLLVGLLRTASCLTLAEVAVVAGLTHPTVKRCLERHRAALRGDAEYAEKAGRAASRAVRASLIRGIV